MKNNTQHPTNFWFGFALGTVSALSLTYLLGTKKGRDVLKKTLESIENLDPHAIDLTALMERITTEIAGKTSTQGLPVGSSPASSSTTDVGQVMNKIRSIAQPNKFVKKFFAKGGKLLGEE